MLATNPTQPNNPQRFRHLIVANSRYWLGRVEREAQAILPETPQLFKALSYALDLPEAAGTAYDLLRHLSPLMIRQGEFHAWESLLKRGIARSAAEGQPAEIELRLHLGNIYRLQGRLEEARMCFLKALKLCHDHPKHQPKLFILLALNARASGDHDIAVDYCQQVLDNRNVALSDRAETFNIMGLVAYDQRQWDEALAYFDQSLTLYHSMKDKYEVARVLTNRGMVLQRNRRWDEAEKCYLQAIKKFTDLNDQIERFKAANNLGNILLMKKNYKEAILVYQQCLSVFQRHNYQIDFAHVYNNLGMAYTGLSEWQEAETYFVASVETWEGLADEYNLANALDNFGAMLIKVKRFTQARKVLEKALESLDGLPDSKAKHRLQNVIKGRLDALNDRTTHRTTLN